MNHPGWSVIDRVLSEPEAHEHYTSLAEEFHKAERQEMQSEFQRQRAADRAMNELLRGKLG